jgi:hypothetical protein
MEDNSDEEDDKGAKRSGPVAFFKVVDLNTNKSIKRTLVGQIQGKLEKNSKIWESSSESDNESPKKEPE